MSGPEDWRAHPRVAVEGTALWSAGRIEGRCRVRDLSMGGVGISELMPPLRIGTRLHVTLVIGERRLESVAVEVVQTSGRELGLRFRKLNRGFRRELEALIAELASGEL